MQCTVYICMHGCGWLVVVQYSGWGTLETGIVIVSQGIKKNLLHRIDIKTTMVGALEIGSVRCGQDIPVRSGNTTELENIYNLL